MGAGRLCDATKLVYITGSLDQPDTNNGVRV